ncbi:MAG: xanthine dehydrogenase family protein subunit M [Desulfobacteraceae bacterium]|jgi:carbon-monoxide dehydrogenase medium subunit
MVTFYRRLPKFDYIKPKSIDEALDLLGENSNGDVKVYAGGTDVIPRLKSRLMQTPKVLIDLKGIPGLDYIEYDDKEGLRIGALATISSVAHSVQVREKFGILSQAAGSIASTQVQNRGTIVGNICNAVPSADSAPALLCLGAKLSCVSSRGERLIDIEDFFTGPNQTALNMDELVKEIRIPNMPLQSKGVYIKLSPRSRMDLAVVGVGSVVVQDNGLIQEVRIALGAVAPTPMRAKRAEDVLKGEKVRAKTVLKAAETASAESEPIDDHRASAEYRKMMVEALVKRAINNTLPN